MKKLSILSILLVMVIVLIGCAGTTTTSASSPTSSAASGTPQYGGTMRVICTYGLTSVGYPPNDGGIEVGQDVTQRLVNWDINGNTIPELATSWDQDPTNNTLTWHLRQGVTFTDGTPFNADVAKWNFEREISLNRLTDADKVKSLDVVDNYTLRMNLTQLTSLSVLNYGWVAMYSSTALQQNGEDWAKTHPVGVGPFTLTDWAPGDHADYKKVDNYYVSGTPYLDGINFRVIPDATSAEAMMEAGQADLWFDVPIKQAVDLANKGLKVNSAVTGFFWGLLANSTTPGSKWANKDLREALEYAINRPALAASLGYGKYEALTQLAPEGSSGYNPGYDPRPYNPDKAKQLIKDAGYSNGFQTSILCDAQSQDYATAIQGYLQAVGIDAKIDLADFARFNSEFMSGYFGGQPFPDLAVGMVGIDLPWSTSLLRHFGPSPMTGILAITGAKSSDFLADCNKMYNSFDPTQLATATKAAAKQAEEDALLVPLLKVPWISVMQNNVHDDSNTIHNVVWNLNESWISK